MVSPLQPGALGARPDHHQVHGPVAVPNNDYGQAQLVGQPLVYGHLLRPAPVQGHYPQREESETCLVQVRHLLLGYPVALHYLGQLVYCPQAALGRLLLLSRSVLERSVRLPRLNVVLVAPTPYPIVHLAIGKFLAVSDQLLAEAVL